MDRKGQDASQWNCLTFNQDTLQIAKPRVSHPPGSVMLIIKGIFRGNNPFFSFSIFAR